MRLWRIFIAHVRSNGLVLLDLVTDTLTYNPAHIKPPLLVYTRWSVDPKEGTRARQIGVGFWSNTPTGRTWTDFRIYFKEDYNLETQTWNRVIPPPRRVSPTSRPTR